MKSLLSRLALFCALLAPVAARAAAPGLATSASAFIRAQAHSPVNWTLWNADLPARAKGGQKPVYVFIGSFLSELSRATCEQSFTNADAAAYLNGHFVCVLVDSEEQPDVAAAARLYLQTVKQTVGWPAHLWLTPELQPYEGAGYLPPSEEWGRSSFSMVAHQAGNAWAADPGSCRGHAREAVTMMAMRGPETLPNFPPASLKDKLAEAAVAWRATFDSGHGGFGIAPKSPEPELLRFLLHQSPADRETALTALRALLNGAICDPLDGGFFRRATDDAWRVPYLQKTLSDQARLALAFLDAAQVTGDATLARGARGALDYALSRLAAPDGSFAAAEDATSNERSGYYVWSEAGIDAALGPGAPALKSAYGVQPGGNVSTDEDPAGVYRGKNFLFRSAPPGDAAAEAKLTAARGRLRAARDQRPLPARDDRASAGAHGLMLAALARAATQLNEPSYLAAATLTFEVVQKQLVASAEGDVRRLCGGAAPGAPADYAALALGCREFSKAARNADADALANRLLARAGSTFFDAGQGRYLASPATLPAGLFVRAPTVGDPLTAEALALMAGAPPEQTAAMTKGLSALLNEDGAVAGDVLLALQR
jgi:uncharacterized protein YyaL (SSP411 family)